MGRGNFYLYWVEGIEYISSSQTDEIKRYREWNIGKNGVGNPTTETGNNESPVV